MLLFVCFFFVFVPAHGCTDATYTRKRVMQPRISSLHRCWRAPAARPLVSHFWICATLRNFRRDLFLFPTGHQETCTTFASCPLDFSRLVSVCMPGQIECSPRAAMWTFHLRLEHLPFFSVGFWFGLCPAMILFRPRLELFVLRLTLVIVSVLRKVQTEEGLMLDVGFELPACLEILYTRFQIWVHTSLTLFWLNPFFSVCTPLAL